MSMRIYSTSLFALTLIGCGVESPEPEGAKIACAIGPGAEMAKVCTLEVTSPEDVIVHHPDGGFRRLAYEGEAIRSADGAFEAETTLLDAQDQVQVAINGDRYILPASLAEAQ